MARTSSVISTPTGHRVMQRPQLRQPERPNWSIREGRLVSHPLPVSRLGRVRLTSLDAFRSLAQKSITKLHVGAVPHARTGAWPAMEFCSMFDDPSRSAFQY
jgi:hypothetical protein